MQHSTGSFTGLYGTEIFTQRWLPEGKPRGAILIVHGIAEHSGRYAHVAAHLVEHGCAVYTLDLRGHGRSGGPRVEVDSFDDYVVDVRTFYEQVRAAQPDLPMFLYGHSMGALIALFFAVRWQGELAGLILSGTPFRMLGQYRLTVPLARALARLVPRVPLIPLLPHFISRDPNQRRRYWYDPLVSHWPLRIGQAVGLINAADDVVESVLPSLRVPVLALHGGADHLSRAVSAQILRASCAGSSCTVIVYPGLRHEIHQEPERGQVLSDIAAWLDWRLSEPRAQTSSEAPPRGE